MAAVVLAETAASTVQETVRHRNKVLMLRHYPCLLVSALADSPALLLLLLLLLCCTHIIPLAGAAVWLHPQCSSHPEQPAVSG
jgi:hypothetical protein